jgi:hypothetical protein
VLVSLWPSLADRWGRRRLILIALVGACAANALTALAPTFEVFTGTQLLSRALVNTALIVAGIAAVEDAPEGARAFATGMFALALGAGFGLSVVLLPLADLGDYGWRISFALKRPSCSWSRSSPVTSRRRTGMSSGAQEHNTPALPHELVDSACSFRFLLLERCRVPHQCVQRARRNSRTDACCAHDFTNSDIALFRTVCRACPASSGWCSPAGWRRAAAADR